MKMKLKLAAEDFSDSYGLLVMDDSQYYRISLEEMSLSSNLMDELKCWYESYYKFTGMNKKELESHTLEINNLDELGMNLLKEIFNSLTKPHNIKESIYYSRGLDKVLLI